jgi:hypothetical protein
MAFILYEKPQENLGKEDDQTIGGREKGTNL